MIAQNHYFHVAGTESNVLGATIGPRWSGRPPEAKITGDPDDAPEPNPTVFVVDPDPATGTLINELLQGYQITVEVYSSGREFFAAFSGDEPGCLVLEQRICDISGIQIQRRLAERNQRLPMIYVVAPGLDVSTAVALMRGGAIHVVEKPLRQNELVLHDAIQEALSIDQNARRKESGKLWLRDSIALLNRKDRQLLGLVAAAKSIKAIAKDLSICSRAVELRRRTVMDKLGLKLTLELQRFAILAWQEYSRYLELAEPHPVADCVLV